MILLKALFVLKPFGFLSWLSGYVKKRLEKKAKGIFIVYDVTYWTTNNCNTYTLVTGTRQRNLVQLKEYNGRNIFLKKLYTKWVEKLVPEPFIKNYTHL